MVDRTDIKWTEEIVRGLKCLCKTEVSYSQKNEDRSVVFSNNKRKQNEKSTNYKRNKKNEKKRVFNVRTNGKKKKENTK